MSIKIYHNPRCGTSRKGLAILENSKKDYEIIRYMDKALSVSELKKLVQLLGISPIELVRTKESIWKESYKNKNLSDEDILQAMIDHPKLIERPIVVNGPKAVIGRPVEKIDAIL